MKPAQFVCQLILCIIVVEANEEKVKIRGAFQYWMDNTCVRFQEVPHNFVTTGHHIMLTRDGRG